MWTIAFFKYKTASCYVTMSLKPGRHLQWIEMDRFDVQFAGFKTFFTFSDLLRVDNLEVPCSNMHASHWSLYLTYPGRKAVRFKVLFWWQHRWRITEKINFLNTANIDNIFLFDRISVEFKVDIFKLNDWISTKINLTVKVI